MNTRSVKDLARVMEALEERTGGRIPDGYDPRISISRPTLDPIIVCYLQDQRTSVNSLLHRSKAVHCFYTRYQLLSIACSKMSYSDFGE